MKPEAIIDALTFDSYRHARETMSAAELATIFQNAAKLEALYRDEINDYVETAIRMSQERRHSGGPDGDKDTFGRKMEPGS